MGDSARTPRRVFLAGLGAASTAALAGLPSGIAEAATPAKPPPEAVADVAALASVVLGFVPSNSFTRPTPDSAHIANAIADNGEITASAALVAITALSTSDGRRFAALGRGDRLTRLAELAVRPHTLADAHRATRISLAAQGIRYPDLADTTASIFLDAVRIYVARRREGVRS
jgi:hypothetical protein